MDSLLHRPDRAGGATALTALLVSLLALLSGCYVVRQSLHHNELFNSRVPIDQAIHDEAYPVAVRQGLQEVIRIMAFARQQGLNTEGAYRYYIHTSEPAVSYIVQAARPDRLEFVRWWFPVVGRVPYLGFFSAAERDQRAAQLRAQGLDVHTGSAGAFSSLGWFDDPVFTSMVKRNHADLASLILHELTHRTVWIPGSAEFNENLAEFVGVHLTPGYLRYAGREDLLGRFQDRQQDRKAFLVWLNDLKSQAKKLYSESAGLSPEELRKRKAEMFRQYSTERKPAFKVADYVKGEDWNNASLLAANLYAPDMDRFGRSWKCSGARTAKEYLEALSAWASHVDDPFDAVDMVCSGPDRPDKSG